MYEHNTYSSLLSCVQCTQHTQQFWRLVELYIVLHINTISNTTRVVALANVCQLVVVLLAKHAIIQCLFALYAICNICDIKIRVRADFTSETKQQKKHLPNDTERSVTDGPIGLDVLRHRGRCIVRCRCRKDRALGTGTGGATLGQRHRDAHGDPGLSCGTTDGRH